MKPTRSQARTRVLERDATLSSLDFLRWARHELARRPVLKVRLHGSSMEPVIWDGEVVLVERIDGSPVRKDDVVLYCSLSETAVIHRVVGFSENSYGPLVITRGDGCTLGDVPVPVDRVLGRVIAVERGGELLPFLPPDKSWFERARDFFALFFRRFREA